MVRRYVLGDVNAGNLIGQYRILRTIGAGGMGTIYLAEHILLGRRAAIKTLRPALSVQPEIAERFFTEARATSTISDPGVVQVFDFGYHVDGTAYIVMELLEGEALSARIARLGRLAPIVALRIARQVAGALAAAHACGIVHRDLKPDNVFLIPDAEAQGGSARSSSTSGSASSASSARSPSPSRAPRSGPRSTCRPSSVVATGRVDHRSDMYALGCVLFHMLVGRPPFEAEGAGEYIVAHMQQPAPAPSTLVDGLPAPLDPLLARCLAKAPADRFPTMTALQHAIEQVVAGLSTPRLELVEPRVGAVPLGQGFASAFDVNLATSAPSMARWFIDESTPTTLGCATGAEQDTPVARAPRRPGLRVPLAILGVAGAIMAVLATQVLTAEDRAAFAASAVEVARRAADPERSAITRLLPPPPPPRLEPPPPPPEASAPPPEPAVGGPPPRLAETAPAPKVAGPSRPSPSRTRRAPRRSVQVSTSPTGIVPPGTSPAAATPTAPLEDLCDTR